MAFYAVPHAGSTKFAEYVKMLLRCNNRHHPGIMDNIQPWQRDMEELSVDFDDIVNGNKINIYMLFVRAGQWSKWYICVG